MPTRKFVRRILGPDTFHWMERAGFISAQRKRRGRGSGDEMGVPLPRGGPRPLSGGAAASIDNEHGSSA